MGSLWRVLENETVQRCLFQYALTGGSSCEGCAKPIPKNALRAKVENGTKFYHFDCFFIYETTAKCRKDEIMIAHEKVNSASGGHLAAINLKYFKDKNPYISLETLDKLITGLNPLIRSDDVKRIREQIALAQAGKTPYYIPSIVKRQHHYCFYCNRDNELDPAKRYHTNGLRYDQMFYHPQCLAQSGIVNVDAKQIHGYDSLDDEEDKEFLDEVFQKDNEAGPIFMAHTQLGLEHCASKDCNHLKPIEEGKKPKKYRAKEYQRAILHGDLRIRYEHFSYHPECFAEMGLVNVNSEDIKRYGRLDELNQEILDDTFKKTSDYDVPIVERAKEDGYCSADSCSRAKAPSKFPYPYTVKENELQIRYKGGNYHPTCFQASGKIDIDAKNIRNFENLVDEDKRIISGIFKKSRKRKSSIIQSDDDSSIDGEEYPTKRKRLSTDDEEGTEYDADFDDQCPIPMQIVRNPEESELSHSETLDESAINNGLDPLIEPNIDAIEKQEHEESQLHHSQTFDESTLNEAIGLDAMVEPKEKIKQEYEESEFGQSSYMKA